MHRRLRPCVHRFRYHAFWLLIDLDELDELSRRLCFFSHNRPNLFSLTDTDHGNGTITPLRSQAERQLRHAGIDLAGGSIDLLCMPRTLGFCFNPISIYFCRHANGTLVALIYEVHNTFGERHSYIIPVEHASEVLRQHCRKAFYVSPFMDMNLRYEFRISGPDERITVGIRTNAPTGAIMDAVLTGVRRDLTDRTLMRVCLTIPAVTWKVVAAIHWEAFRLWMKELRVRQRPVRSDHMTTIGATKPRVSD
jgi:uncharacterized protein